MKYLPHLTILTAFLVLLLACTSHQSVIANESTPSVVSSHITATKTPQPTKSSTPTYASTPTVTSASDDKLPIDIPSESSLNLSEHQFRSDSPFVVMDEAVYLKVPVDEQIHRLKTVFSQATVKDYCTPNISETKWLCMLHNAFFDNLLTRDEIDTLRKSVGGDEDKLNLALEELLTDYSTYPPVLIISENEELIDFLPENENPVQNPNWKSTCDWLSDNKVRCHIGHGTHAWVTTIFDLGEEAFIPLPDEGRNINIFGNYYLQHNTHLEKVLYDLDHVQLDSFITPAIHVSDDVLAIVELCKNGPYCFHYIRLEDGGIKDDLTLDLSSYFSEDDACYPHGDDVSDFINNSYLTVEADSYNVTICDKTFRISSDDIRIIEVSNQ